MSMYEVCMVTLSYFFQLRLIGEKDDTPVHFCDKCGLPIKTYGRMVRIVAVYGNVFSFSGT